MIIHLQFSSERVIIIIIVSGEEMGEKGGEGNERKFMKEASKQVFDIERC
jgi:hypothetical protein